VTGPRRPDEVQQRRLSPAQIEESLAEIKSLSHEVAEAWTSDQSAVELVAEGR
jgi:hypothetical protein